MMGECWLAGQAVRRRLRILTIVLAARSCDTSTPANWRDSAGWQVMRYLGACGFTGECWLAGHAIPRRLRVDGIVLAGRSCRTSAPAVFAFCAGCQVMPYVDSAGRQVTPYVGACSFRVLCWLSRHAVPRRIRFDGIVLAGRSCRTSAPAVFAFCAGRQVKRYLVACGFSR